MSLKRNKEVSEAKTEEKKFKKEHSDDKVKRSKKEFKKRMKYGSLSVALTAIFIGIIVLINVLVSVLANRFTGFSFDTTSSKFFEISDASKDYLKTLDKYEIEIVFAGRKQGLMTDKNYQKIIPVVEKYTKLAPHLNVSFLDLDKNPTFTSKYDNVELHTGDALVICGDRYRQLTADDFLISEDDGQENQEAQNPQQMKPKKYSLNVEHAVTTAIMVVTASDNPVATVIKGHGEKELDALGKLLKNNGFKVNEQDISKEFDKDSNLLVIVAPKRDYSEDELKRLDEFLYNDGKYSKNVMYVADYDQPILPNIEAFLNDWGFVLKEGVVYESDNKLSVASNPFLSTLEYVDPDTTLSTALSEVGAYGDHGRPTTIANRLDANMENKVVLKHTETTKTAKYSNGSFIKDEKKDENEYVALAYTSNGKYNAEMELRKSNVIYAESTKFFEGQLFMRDYAANSDVVMSVVDNVLGRENKLIVPSKNLDFSGLGITRNVADIIGSIFAVVTPLVLLIVCLVVSIRRRFL